MRIGARLPTRVEPPTDVINPCGMTFGVVGEKVIAGLGMCAALLVDPRSLPQIEPDALAAIRPVVTS